MQIGIHVEDGQAYVCIIDGEKTIEKDPVAINGAWTDYLMEVQKRGSDHHGRIGIVMDEMTPEVMEELDEIRHRTDFGKTVWKLYTKEEAAAGLVRFQNHDAKSGKVAVFDYNGRNLMYYDVAYRGDAIRVETHDYTSMMPQSKPSKQEKDRAFLKVIGQTMAAGVTSAAYLCGEGFEGQWFHESTRALCSGRRVFMGRHLFACGAAFLAGENKEDPNHKETVILTDDMTICQVGLTLHHHGRDIFYPLLKEGIPWYECKNEIEVFVAGINKLMIELRTRSGVKKASVLLPLTGIQKTKDAVSRLRIRGDYLAADRCRMKVSDEGFGQIRPATCQVWQQIIYLERGDFL
jgi:hypothetical protein